MDNLQYKDFPEVCRICLRKQINLIDIFHPVLEDSKNIVDDFHKIFSDNIVKDDGKPEQICTDCLNTLNQICKLITLYDRSKKVCERILEQKHDEEIVEAKQCRNLVCSNVCCFCGFDYRLDFCKTSVRGRPMRLKKTHILEEHLIDIRNKGDFYFCLKCKIQFNKRILIEDHFRSEEHQNRTCQNCESEFNTIKTYFAHLKSCCKSSKKLKKKATNIVENEIYKCIHCKKTTIKGFDQMLAHFREKHKQNYVCMVCDKNINAHMELHLYGHRPLRMKHLCLRCRDYFQTEAELEEHKKNFDHSKKKCDTCGLIINTRKFAQHKFRHEKSASYICESCGASFKARYNLDRHYKVKHLGHRYYCDQCSQSYSTYKDLLRHTARMHQTTPISKDVARRSNNDRSRRTVFCLDPTCKQTFPNQGALLEHMNSVHEKFTCQTCNRDFFSPTLFQSHCMLHVWQAKPPALNPTSCRICNENQADTSTLSNHVLNEHKLYLCPETDCGEIFQTIPALQKHKVNAHEKAEALKSQFVCSICNQKFSTARNFSVHQERHSQNRKFKCDVCSLKFSTSGQLRLHVRTHTGERPYVCRFCTKSFISSYAKKCHERIHTGEKPYSCPYCEHRFADSSYRKQHILKHEQKNNELRLLQQSS